MILIAALALAAGQPVDFKGIKLQSSLTTFKALPLNRGRYGIRRMGCSDEAELSAQFALPQAEQLAGIVICTEVQRVGQIWSLDGVELTPTYQATTRYRFYRSTLFTIDVYPDIQASEIVDLSLRRKFGPPTRAEVGTLQLRSGGSFPQSRLEWLVGDQTIVMATPDVDLQSLSVRYNDLSASDAAAAAIQLEQRIGTGM